MGASCSRGRLSQLTAIPGAVGSTPVTVPPKRALPAFDIRPIGGARAQRHEKLTRRISAWWRPRVESWVKPHAFRGDWRGVKGARTVIQQCRPRGVRQTRAPSASGATVLRQTGPRVFVTGYPSRTNSPMFESSPFLLLLKGQTGSRPRFGKIFMLPEASIRTHHRVCSCMTHGQLC